jgi:hypothetical protein
VVDVAIVMMSHPCHGLIHCHKSQSNDTYPNAVHISQEKMAWIPMSVDMTKNEYMDPKEVSQIPMQCHESQGMIHKPQCKVPTWSNGSQLLCKPLGDVHLVISLDAT